MEGGGEGGREGGKVGRELAVVNEPKWSPVIHCLICPTGARERSDGWLIAAPPLPRWSGGSTEVRAMAAAFSVQLEPRAQGRGLAGTFLSSNEAARNGSGQLREREREGERGFSHNS